LDDGVPISLERVEVREIERGGECMQQMPRCLGVERLCGESCAQRIDVGSLTGVEVEWFVGSLWVCPMENKPRDVGESPSEIVAECLGVLCGSEGIGVERIPVSTAVLAGKRGLDRDSDVRDGIQMATCEICSICHFRKDKSPQRLAHGIQSRHDFRV
jgi:hypothetical protein